MRPPSAVVWPGRSGRSLPRSEVTSGECSARNTEMGEQCRPIQYFKKKVQQGRNPEYRSGHEGDHEINLYKVPTGHRKRSDQAHNLQEQPRKDRRLLRSRI